MSYLVLVRHGESEWNASGKWTGLIDISLSEKGKKEAEQAGTLLKDISFDHAFTSGLIRSQETLSIILTTIHQNVPTTSNDALNERDYGIYTGKNKWDIQKQLGEETFIKLRRGFDTSIPKGESLKDVYNRVIPYFKTTILPLLEQQKNVLISAHGNSLRALVKYLENISDVDIQHLEIATGEVYVYQVNDQGKIVSKEIRK